MAEFPALPLWTDALLGDTTHLSTTEFGAYVLMLLVAWRAPKCDLPDDDRSLAKITRLGNKWARHREVLREFWTADAGRLTQKRLLKERAFLETQSGKQADRANKRWARERQNPAADPAQGTELSPGQDTNRDRMLDALTTPNQLESHKTADAAAMPRQCPHTHTHTQEERTQDPDGSCVGALSAQQPTKGKRNGNPTQSGTRLPEDWEPGPEYIAFAESLCLDVRAVAEEFRDYWIAVSGAKGRKLNWFATWRNRCRYIAEKRDGADQRGRGRSGPVSVVAAFGKLVAQAKN